MWKSALEWIAVIAVMALLYPVISTGGWLDSLFGPYWFIAAIVLACCAILLFGRRPSAATPDNPPIVHPSA